MATDQATLSNPAAAGAPGAGTGAGAAASALGGVPAVAGKVAAATQVATDKAVTTISDSLDRLNGGRETGPLAVLRSTIQSPTARKALPIFLIMLVIVAFVGLFQINSKPVTYRPLMPGMSEADQQLAVDALKLASFDAKIDPTTGALSVPTDKYHEARIYLASKGIPKQPAPTGIDALNGDNAMTTSQFMEQVKYIKAMENELARSITQIGTIQAARVHLALPKQSVFVRDRAQPKASVVVTPYQGRAVTAGQVDAIVHLVSSSIPYLAPQAVSVVDNMGNLLTNRKENTPMGLTEAQLAHKQTVEDGYRSRIMQILTPVLGEANVRSQVDVVLDFTQIESASEDFDRNKSGPKTRSEVLAEDRTQRLNAEGVPGSLTNAPPPPVESTKQTGASTDDALQESTTLSKRATRNYEVDKTVRYVKNPMGNVQRISVAVVVNEKAGGQAPAAPAADGAKPAANALQGYSQEEIDRLTNLVKGVVGFQEERGDVVTLVPAKFAPVEDPMGPWYANETIMENVKLGLAALVFLIILLTIVNPVINFLTGRTLSAEQLARIHQEQLAIAQVKQQAEMEAMQAAEAAKAPVLGPNGEVLGADGMPVRNAEGKFIGADGQPLPEPELSAEEMGVVEMQEGETLEDIKAKLKPKKSSISLDLLNTANSYDDKVALIRFLVSEDSGRVANVFKTLMRPAGG
jgi:flagellar M-ring protein FliF